MERDKERLPSVSNVPEEVASVAFVGSREFQPLSLVYQVMKGMGRCKVISGGARGVDQAAEDASDALGYPKKIMKADWGKYGKSAGPRRNHEMVCNSDAAVVFWDGKSRGTLDFINKAMKEKIPMFVFEVYGRPKQTKVTRYNTHAFEDDDGQLKLLQIKGKHSE